MSKKSGREPMLSAKHPAHARVGGRLTPEQRSELLDQNLGEGFLVYKSGPDSITEVPFYVNRQGRLKRLDNRDRIEKLPVDRPIRPQDLNDPEYDDDLDDFYSGTWDDPRERTSPEFARQGAIRWAQKLLGGRYGIYMFVDTTIVRARKDKDVVGLGIMDPSGIMRVDSLIQPNRKLTPNVLAAAGASKRELEQAPGLCDISEAIHDALHGAYHVVYGQEAFLTFRQAYHRCDRDRQTRHRGAHDIKHEYARFVGGIEFKRRGMYWKQFELEEACRQENIEADFKTRQGRGQAALALVQKMADAGRGMRWHSPQVSIPDLDGPD